VNTKNQTISTLAVFFTTIVYFTGSAFYYPFSRILNKFSNNFFTCQMLKHTGLPCPTCGSTRGAYFFIQGELIKSFKFNAGIFCLSIFILYLFIKSCFYLIKKKPFKETEIFNKYIIISLITIFLLQWLIKIFLQLTS